MKLEVVLRPCPWCRKTPELWMPIPEKTWCWWVVCDNKDCHMKPRSPHVSIRNTTKKNFVSFYYKIERLAHTWNGGNPICPYEMKIIDLEKLAELNQGAEFLCIADPWYKRISVI